MKRIAKLLFVLAIALGACQNELSKINVNPNNIETPNITTLTSNVIANEFWNNTYQAWTLGNAMSQLVVFSASYYNLNGRYTPYNNSSYWSTCYANARDAATIVSQSKATKNYGNQAVGLALEAYAFSQLTDCWGDIPYKKALQGSSGNYLSPYDNQQTVYTDPINGILAKLNTADSLLAANSSLVSGDILYDGNAVKWRKFINALRLRFLLRISAKQDISSEMQSIVTKESNFLFQNASESAALSLPLTLPWNFPSYQDRTGDFAIKAMDSILYNFYVKTGDRSRMTLFFTPTPVAGKPTVFSFDNYRGLPQVSDADTWQTNHSSSFSNTLYPLSTPVSQPINYSRIITYAEVQFILAEAALKGYLGTVNDFAAASTYYTNGIMGAYAELGLPVSDATNYAASNALNTSDAAAALEQIIMQKWALNLNNGFEGWFEHRRTGIPAFDLTENQNGGVISSKFLYPTDEQFINATNYNNQIQKMGGKDDANYKAWW